MGIAEVLDLAVCREIGLGLQSEENTEMRKKYNKNNVKNCISSSVSGILNE